MSKVRVMPLTTVRGISICGQTEDVLDALVTSTVPSSCVLLFSAGRTAALLEILHATAAGRYGGTKSGAP